MGRKKQSRKLKSGNKRIRNVSAAFITASKIQFEMFRVAIELVNIRHNFACGGAVGRDEIDVSGKTDIHINVPKFIGDNDSLSNLKKKLEGGKAC